MNFYLPLNYILLNFFLEWDILLFINRLKLLALEKQYIIKKRPKNILGRFFKAYMCYQSVNYIISRSLKGRKVIKSA